jgi:RimJ/RimL family protein N-acetyltransferase
VTKPLELVGATIVLRDWKMHDIGPWMKWMKPSHAWQELDGPQFPPPTEKKIGEWRESIEQGIQTMDFPTPRVRLPICLRSTDELIGRVSWYWKEDYRCLGISIYDPAYWRQGIGYEALGLWGDYLFEAAPEATRMILETWSGNKGMVRLAEKLGFLEEESLRTQCIVRGREYDSLVFGVVREDW